MMLPRTTFHLITLLIGATVVPSGAVLADRKIIGVSWRNFQEARRKTGEQR